jgi:hypothetical protein
MVVSVDYQAIPPLKCRVARLSASKQQVPQKQELRRGGLNLVQLGTRPLFGGFVFACGTTKSKKRSTISSRSAPTTGAAVCAKCARSETRAGYLRHLR